MRFRVGKSFCGMSILHFLGGVEGEHIISDLHQLRVPELMVGKGPGMTLKNLPVGEFQGIGLFRRVVLEEVPGVGNVPVRPAQVVHL